MRPNTQELAQLVVDNRQAIAEAYKRKVAENDELAISAASWALAGKRVDAAHLRETIDYLKSQSKALSSERGSSRTMLANYMAMSEDRDAYLARVRMIFSKIMEGKKVESGSRFAEAMVIANNTDSDEQAIEVAERTEELFERMRKVHPWLTGDRDRTFIALLALSDRDPDALLADAEECYQLLGDGFKLSGGRQTMANILSLSPQSPAEKVARVKELYEAFKANKVGIGWSSGKEYAVLALLAADDRPASEVAADVAEINTFLKKQKGFGNFTLLSSSTRVIIASVVSTFAHSMQEEADSMAVSISLAVFQAIVDWIIVLIVVVAV